MSGISFLSAPLLWGLALASVPILIHLLFRRRFRRIEWAPMRYLKLSIQKNRRRFRIEQLLLLALRTAIVLVMFFMLARPVMHAEGLAGWLAGRSRTSQLLVLDDSLSMGARDAGRSAFDRARELAQEVVRHVGPQDRFTLVVASRPQAPLLREVEIQNADEVRSLIAGLTVSDAFVSWKSVLTAVDDLVTSGTFPIRELTLITDLRRAGWNDELAELGDRWAGAQVRLRILDVGSGNIENVSLSELKQIDRVSLAGAPTRYEATVRNHSPQDLEGAEATFTVDGKPSLVRLPTLAPGATTQMPLVATLQEAGLHHVALKLPQDDLPGDDERLAITKTQARLRIVLVDGEPSSEPLAGEVDFLALAMSLGAGEADAFHVEVITDSDLASVNAAPPDLLVLANIASVTPAQAEDLARLVQAGMGLIVFLGDQVDANNYNQLLYRSGAGLLPAPLDLPIDEELSGLIVEPGLAGPLDPLLQLKPAVLERVAIKKWYQLAIADAPGARVLARWNNAGTAPAAREKKFAAGTVILWTIAADRQWSDWPTDPSYVLAMREAAAGIARTDAGLRQVTAGELLRYPLAAGDRALSPTVETPGGTGAEPLAIEIEKSDSATNEERQTLTYADTRRAGLYKLNWKDAKEQPHGEVMAVNSDARESELERIPADKLRELFGRLAPEVIAGTASDDNPIAVRGREIWRFLASCMLVMLMVETCFATWAGRQR
jgi:hypothetical protein